MAKASLRDLPVLSGKRGNASMTVAATSFLANRAGIRVFATGGPGGVHRGAAESFDESADIFVLAKTPITLVPAGVKSMLDIGATLERLETLSIPVRGCRTALFPRFWLRESNARLDWSVESADEVANVMRARDKLGLRQAILLANPVPAALEWDQKNMTERCKPPCRRQKLPEFPERQLRRFCCSRWWSFQGDAVWK